MRMLKQKNILANNRGILTIDFIFAFVLVFAFTGILFAFSITFSAVEVAQYATFASSRAYFAAHKNSDEQKKLGEEKFNELVKSKDAKLGFMFKNGWFELGDVKISDFNDEFGEDPGNDSDTFIGARTALAAKILNFNIPLFGPATKEELSANISSYLMREPTEEECQDFVLQRFQAIQKLKPGFSQSYVRPGDYAFIMDGGC